jgi:hypothetical protein
MFYLLGRSRRRWAMATGGHTKATYQNGTERYGSGLSSSGSGWVKTGQHSMIKEKAK